MKLKEVIFHNMPCMPSAEAIQDSGLELENMDPFDTGVIWGTGQGGMWTFEKVMDFAKGRWYSTFQSVLCS
jgi:3-oxoacyl-[acyl-carrier-protein] synthase II